MSCSDPIADMLTVIRNGVMAAKDTVSFPHSRLKVSICEVLKDEGYLSRVEILETQPAKTITVGLKYDDDGMSVIHQIKRISRPGKRVYRNRKDLKPVIRGFGITVVSTSRGVLSDRAARAANIGGEVLCEIR
ncbi:MAG: 30S ribosomal protein S8 [Planctomycetota bacterium]|jgi:small subunit ribosomal protein S8|nr:30S ribosomal protein S8 [Planctomycetota bacterium]